MTEKTRFSAWNRPLNATMHSQENETKSKIQPQTTYTSNENGQMIKERVDKKDHQQNLLTVPTNHDKNQPWTPPPSNSQSPTAPSPHLKMDDSFHDMNRSLSLSSQIQESSIHSNSKHGSLAPSNRSNHHDATWKAVGSSPHMGHMSTHPPTSPSFVSNHNSSFNEQQPIRRASIATEDDEIIQDSSSSSRSRQGSLHNLMDSFTAPNPSNLSQNSVSSNLTNLQWKTNNMLGIEGWNSISKSLSSPQIIERESSSVRENQSIGSSIWDDIDDTNKNVTFSGLQDDEDGNQQISDGSLQGKKMTKYFYFQKRK